MPVCVCIAAVFPVYRLLHTDSLNTCSHQTMGSVYLIDIDGNLYLYRCRADRVICLVVLSAAICLQVLLQYLTVCAPLGECDHGAMCRWCSSSTMPHAVAHLSPLSVSTRHLSYDRSQAIARALSLPISLVTPPISS